MKYSITLILMFFGLMAAQAQSDTANGEMTLKSSVVCNMCKNTIENGLAYNAGVKSIRVNVDANEIYIKFNPKKTTAHEIKQAITALGYVADDMMPTQEAYDNLHECCKADLGKH